jgi:putative transcriptional regulator
MSEAYKSIMAGLQEAIDDAKGEKKLKRTTYTVIPLKEYYPEEVKSIRKKTGLSQKALAGYMGISEKTVEAWEKGTNKPSGMASRLLNLLDMDPKFVSKYPFVKYN